AEIGDNDLPVADGAVEDVVAGQRVGGGVLENAGARHLGRLGACAGKQLAPAAGGFGVGDVDRLGVEGEAARAHAGDGGERADAVAVDLEEEVFAFLGGHEIGLRTKLQIL